MALQNRVTPFNTLEAVSARGTFLGNRGILHNADKKVGKSTWKHPRWLTCILDFKGRRRELMVPEQYMHLFFLDEAVSLAAGHRPCKECRKEEYERFASAWKTANGMRLEDPIKADAIDAEVHRSRVNKRSQLRYRSRIEDLPDGSVFSLADNPDAASLLWQGFMHRWSHEGYMERRTPVRTIGVDVLTPRRTIETLATGYVPTVHSSAM